MMPPHAPTKGAAPPVLPADPAKARRGTRTGFTTPSRTSYPPIGARTAPVLAPVSTVDPAIGCARERPKIEGKFLRAAGRKLYLRGTTYGPFRPGEGRSEYGTAKRVDEDFQRMAASGFNCVRTYTVPPRWLLDRAHAHGLRVLVGIAWAQHVTFLDDRRLTREIERHVHASVRACAHHPAVLGYAIGNEIPASIVRWHGAPRIERFIARLCRTAKLEDPDGLVTYVNYPTTEYLRLPFLDFVSFNVYLEAEETLTGYLGRLQNLASDRPLVLAEVGLDSRRNGEAVQAEVLDWQVRAAFAGGCAGTFVFAWTDEWHRGGFEIEDWDFGLTRRDRSPKPALDAVRTAFEDSPFPLDAEWPRMSVVVCSYNGHYTIRETLEGVARLDYPDYEVIVVDDGSHEPLESIVADFDARYIRTTNCGLSAARNTGLGAARGEIVAYIDDDAYPDEHWLRYLALAFKQGDHAGIGGPNLPPPHAGLVADCVANAPGGPIHVLVSDVEAEHVPGCNMALRREALEAIGGFDDSFRVAGDDVDLCWRLQAGGWKLGFSPAATVWHYRRNSVRAYLRQQRGYGRAEAILERKWPQKYNATGHVSWGGRIYADHVARPLSSRRGRIYHGVWGTAPFQSIYEPAPDSIESLLAMPESYLLAATLIIIAALGTLWSPLLLALPMLGAILGAMIVRSAAAAARSMFPSRPRRKRAWLARYGLTVALHLMQPVARLWGRIAEGLTPWRRGKPGFAPPGDQILDVWSERWQDPSDTLRALEAALVQQRMVTVRGGEYDRWDLTVRGGILGGARLLMAVEEHGGGRQLTRIRSWLHVSRAVLWFGFGFYALAVVSLTGADHRVPLIMLALPVLAVGRAIFEGSTAMAAIRQAKGALDESAEDAAEESATQRLLEAPDRSGRVPERTVPEMTR